jgi:hypothetical protein
MRQVLEVLVAVVANYQVKRLVVEHIIPKIRPGITSEMAIKACQQFTVAVDVQAIAFGERRKRVMLANADYLPGSQFLFTVPQTRYQTAMPVYCGGLFHTIEDRSIAFRILAPNFEAGGGEANCTVVQKVSSPPKPKTPPGNKYPGALCAQSKST